MLLEPIGNLMATVPGDVLGDIMGEVTKRRGRVLGMHPAEDGQQTLEADVRSVRCMISPPICASSRKDAAALYLNSPAMSRCPPIWSPKVIEEAKKFIDMKDDEE